MIALIVRTDKLVWARCGEICKTRIYHQVYTYLENGERKLAVFCPRCLSLTTTDVPYKEVPNE